MGRTTLLITMLVLGVALPLAAQPQQQESLGDLARKLREARDKNPKKAPKVFTNDDMPAPPPWESAAAQPAQPAAQGQASNPAPTTDKPATPPPSQETNSNQPESPVDKTQSRDYWQGKFKAARRDVAKAKEVQQLAEDELNLLQIQQAREVDPTLRANLAAKVQDKQSEVDLNKAATEAAQKALDGLEKEFKDSGAPDDWGQTD